KVAPSDRHVRARQGQQSADEIVDVEHRHPMIGGAGIQDHAPPGEAEQRKKIAIPRSEYRAWARDRGGQVITEALDDTLGVELASPVRLDGAWIVVFVDRAISRRRRSGGGLRRDEDE